MLTFYISIFIAALFIVIVLLRSDKAERQRTTFLQKHDKLLPIESLVENPTEYTFYRVPAWWDEIWVCYESTPNKDTVNKLITNGYRLQSDLPTWKIEKIIKGQGHKIETMAFKN